MTDSNLKFRITDYFWPFGVSLLCGCFGLYFATLGLFAIGVSITPWHGLAFGFSALFSAYLVIEGNQIIRWKTAGVILFSELLLCALLVGVASRLDDLSVDGMEARIEPVINLAAGWNTVLDPEFVERERIEKDNPFLVGGSNYQPSSGKILAGYLAFITGEVNAGKAVTPILGLAAFGVAFGGLVALSLPVGWAVVLAALAAMNPVTIYQTSSYYIDGHVATIFTAALFSGIRMLVFPTGLTTKATFLVCLFLLAGSKTSGIFYGATLFILLFTAWYFFGSYKRRKNILVVSGIFLAVLATFTVIRQKGALPSITVEYLQECLDFTDGLKGYRMWAPGLGGGGEPGRLGIFFNSHFSPTSPVADQPVAIKFPFWLNRRELAVFEDLSPQPYAGGFGPLYGAFFILSAASLLLIRSKPPWISWLPLIASFGSIYFSQIWWARWTPQAWLIPLGFLLPVICSFQGQPPGKKWILPFLAVFVGLLNSILILAFYTSGCIKAQTILNSQLAYLHTLPQPLQVHMPKFRSNRVWFIRENLPFEILQEEPPRPRLKLYRTATKVALPPETDPSRELDPKMWKRWAFWKLVEP